MKHLTSAFLCVLRVSALNLGHSFALGGGMLPDTAPFASARSFAYFPQDRKRQRAEPVR